MESNLKRKYEVKNKINKYIEKLAGDNNNWIKFLDTSARTYKYSFSNQLAIHLQRENVTACASMDFWNLIGYYVKKGCKGIRTIEKTKFDDSIYLFDYNDVQPAFNKKPKPIKFWELPNGEREKEMIMQSLLEKQGFVSGNGTFDDMVRETAISFASDLFIEAADKLYELDNSIAENIDEIYEFVQNSVAYVVCKRCKIESNISVDKLRWDIVSSENGINKRLFNMLGEIMVSAASDMLYSIEHEVKAVNEKLAKEKEREKENEKSREHLSSGRRGISESKTAWEVRRDEERISSGGKEVSVYGYVDGRYTGGTLDGDRELSTADASDSNRTNEEIKTDNRGIESERHEPLGERDATDSDGSGKYSDEGVSVQLNFFDASYNVSSDEKVESIESANNLIKHSLLIPDELLTAIICDGNNKGHGKLLIAEEYIKGRTTAELAEFMKSEYKGGKGFVYKNEKYAVWYDEDGITLSKGNTVKSHMTVKYKTDWHTIAEETAKLLDAGTFLTHEELNSLDKHIYKDAVYNIQYMWRDISDSFDKKTEMPFLAEVMRENMRFDKNDIRKYLENEESFSAIRKEIGEFVEAYEANNRVIRFQFYNPVKVKKVLDNLALYAASDIKLTVESEPEKLEHFLTKDEIEETVLSTLNHTSGKKGKIYDYFLGNKNSNERVKFLKEDYGLGGASGPDMIGWDTYSNAMTFTKKDCEKVDVKWSDVVRIIDNLIKSGKITKDIIEKEEIEEIEDDFEEIIDSVSETTELAEAENSEISLEVDEIEEAEDEAEDVDSKEIEEASIYSEHDIFEDDVEKKDYRITDYTLGVGTKAEKYEANIAAIRLLKELERERKFPTETQQQVLSKYVGWGGLSEVFEDNAHYKELKELLTDKEYQEARESVLTAYYTQPIVIEKMYEAVQNLGFEKGTILEPSMAIGNFFGMMPKKLRENSKLYGVELDSISGRIAQKLYPTANIRVTGYEKCDFQPNSFDLAIGNVPFGDYSVNDKSYNSRGFKIHDYFFAKSLDMVRAGGIIAFITSKGTLDKKSDAVRRYLAERAELLGAIRLPNTAFKANAGTEVTSDIIFLQKREKPIILKEVPEWVNVEENNGTLINSYFVQNPEMIIGHMENVSGRFGIESTCVLDEAEQFDELLTNAIKNISGNFEEVTYYDEFDEKSVAIPADINLPNYSYSLVDNKLYYRENSVMYPAILSKVAEQRARSLVKIRELVKNIIKMQLDEESDAKIKSAQAELNVLYDAFTKSYDLINSRANSIAFSDDAGYPLLCSLENIDDEGNLISKADIFTKRTVRSVKQIDKVENADEALAVALNEKGYVDLEYMQRLIGKSKEDLIKDLKGRIFKIPEEEIYVTRDEYLSGNVRYKLNIAQMALEKEPELVENIEALKEVLPQYLTKNEIDARLGSIWIPIDVYEDFIYELLDTPYYARQHIKLSFSGVTGSWKINGMSMDKWRSLVSTTYGTLKASAYRIIENSLNLKAVQITEIVEDANGTKHTVVNRKETFLACAKQDVIKDKFREWIWSDEKRTKRLEEIYNIRFNSNLPREYDGSHLKFSGMNPTIKLREHQKRAVARQLYGGNTLLAHAVGAGKTFEIATAIMEKKRLGLCSKAMLVVPNHLTGQWAQEFMRLYPTANILAVTKKDFTPANRKRFCSRIATGNYDAVIIGHSQFEMIPLSEERQKTFIEEQLNDIEAELIRIKEEEGERFTVKQLVSLEKKLKVKLEKMNEGGRKDNVITFEELGIDFLCVDEAHNYKNLAITTKMNNVAGVSTTGSNKAYDLFAKCRYIDSITDCKGITFATATPISNSMTELYTMQKYLQYDELNELGLITFDAWASTFGETVTAMELAPEGTKYRSRTRFARFFNLPELMSIFKNVADIQTADMLKLDVPEAVKETIVLQPSMMQAALIKEIGERADEIHDGSIDPSEDNMLKVTTDGRKLALDERLLTGEETHPLGKTKVDVLVEKVKNIYDEYKDKKAAQLIFCDQSTPTSSLDGYNVYADVKASLIATGVAESEIAFIHDYNTEAQKESLFSKVRNGNVRILMGSTSKMGAGMNVQNKLIALHHLDVPWRPSDIEQQEGRLVRQGNENEKVFIYRYVTENTFDAYSWQTLEIKQKYIKQIMTSKTPVRSCEDIDETAMDYAEVKTLCTGDGKIKERMELENGIKHLKLIKQSYESEKLLMETKLYQTLPKEYMKVSETLENLNKDKQTLAENKQDEFSIIVNGMTFKDKESAGTAIYNMTAKCKEELNWYKIGSYRGFELQTIFLDSRYRLKLQSAGGYQVDRGGEPSAIVDNLDDLLNSLDVRAIELSQEKQKIEDEMNLLEEKVKEPFMYAEELAEKEKKLESLIAETENEDKREAAAYTNGMEYIHIIAGRKESYVQIFEVADCSLSCEFDMENEDCNSLEEIVEKTCFEADRDYESFEKMNLNDFYTALGQADEKRLEKINQFNEFEEVEID